MFPKYFSFYLNGLFKCLGEIWFIYYLYPNDVIAMKMTPKFRIAFLYVNSAQKTLHLLEIA